MSTPTGRAFSLLSLLQSRSVWTGPELADRLGVTTRTVRRDIDRLRELGYPVLTSAGHGGGYRLGRGQALPPLLLERSEAIAVAVGLRLAAASGISGLEQDALRALGSLDAVLPAEQRGEVDAIAGAAGVLAPEGPRASADVLAIIARAIRDRVRLRLEYRRADGETSTRRTEPHRVLSIAGKWYLYAYDLDREDWRTFRLDRMLDVEVSTLRFPPRETGDIDEKVHTAITSSGYGRQVVVHLGLSVEAARERVPLGAARLEADGPEACMLTAGGHELREIAVHLLLIGAPIEVIEPPELLEELHSLGRLGSGAVAGS